VDGGATTFAAVVDGGGHVHIRKPRNVSSVMGCELNRQLRAPAAGCVESIGAGEVSFFESSAALRGMVAHVVVGEYPQGRLGRCLGREAVVAFGVELAGKLSCASCAVSRGRSCGR
jgi:hypothetical protein